VEERSEKGGKEVLKEKDLYLKPEFLQSAASLGSGKGIAGNGEDGLFLKRSRRAW